MDEGNDFDIAIIRSKTKVTKEFIAKAPNLKLVVRGGWASTMSTWNAVKVKVLMSETPPRHPPHPLLNLSSPSY